MIIKYMSSHKSGSYLAHHTFQLPSIYDQIQVMEGVCKCYDMAEDGIELLVMKTLLSAVTSTSLQVHGDSLLKAVRTCYNIYLGSKSPVNQTTAKASLTQMLVIVFQRMEADSSNVMVQPIVVADLMEPAERSNSDTNITQFVQGFITKVVQDIEGVISPTPALKSMQSTKYDGAFDTAAGADSSSSNDILESTDKDMLDAKYWELNMYKNALDINRKGGESAESEVDKDGDADVQINNKLRRDAFLVFRALCKLSMKNAPQEGLADPFAIRGKIIALELLKILLENAGTIFRTSDRFLGAIKQYLCLSLLKNSASSMMNVFQLSCSIFMSLVSRFRAGLKAEIGVFFPMIVLRVLENVAHPNFSQKTIVLRFLEKLCVDPQILVDIFVNYDCDVDSSNIFERMVNGLLKTAQGVPNGAETSLNPVQDAAFKLAAIKCLVGVLRSMGNWLNRQLRLTESSPYVKFNDGEESTSETVDTISTATAEVPAATGSEKGEENAEKTDDKIGEKNGEASSTSGSRPTEETSEAATFEQRRAHKLEVQEGIALFNKKPRKGIEFLIKVHKVGETPEEVAKFLRDGNGLDKGMIGDYLGEKEDFSLKVMHAYVDSFNFQGMEFDESIRAFLLGFRLPGEAQKIDRIMEKFAERFTKCNPKAFSSADTAYVLAYSVIMLNTDAHNPMVKTKMSKAEFIRNNRGIDDGRDIPEDFMSSLYDRIVSNEIKMKADTLAPSKQQPANSNRMLGLDAILNIVVRKPREDSKIMETSDDVIRHMQEQFKAKAGKSESVYYAASDVELLRPMVDVTWAPMLVAFSVPLDKSEDEVVTFQCLEGFRHAVHITAVLCMRTQRDAFLTSLAKFTSLHSAADIKQKNIDAIKAIISIADEDGNYLQDAWEHILTCVSRFEHLHLIGEGAPPDATFFAAPQNELDRRQSVKGPVLPVLRRKTQGKLQYAAAAARRGSYDSAGVGGGSAGIVTTEQMNNLVSNLNMLEQIGSFEVNKIFTRSQRLNSEAIVDFVKALCKVSMEELRSPSDPRVFSLTKIVEISHFNMTRIRLVWSKMWSVLADYFVTVGCSDNLSVAMYAMDSLRQLAMKFLDRDELANFNFQNEFMKPFVIVMRKSCSVEIRELIIRCVSQMVFARVGNVKSGWKIMFMVFTTAATDEHKSIVLLAFETIEKIVREYFPYITETETTTFTDCVNCLIAFTNSRFNQDVSLNAIAFLRFCALKLAEGELGAATRSKSGMNLASPEESPTFTDKDDHLYFWFPLLAGLSELTFDPRPDIRKSALEVLFDTLRIHGDKFSAGLWEKVFDSVLFPIFDSVRRATDAAHNGEPEKEQEELEMDAWLYETCTLALQLVVDLFVKFYPVVNLLLGRVLSLLTGFIKRPHQSLAAIGVAAFVRLMSNAGRLFSDEKWLEILNSLHEAALETLPDIAHLVATAQDQQVNHMARTSVSSRAESQDGHEPSIALHNLIQDVKCRTAVQLLLVQAMTEMYNSHGAHLSAANTMQLLDTLHTVAVHAHKVNGDHALRQQLQELRLMPDPPLLRLESEAYQAYLAMLQHLPMDKPSLAKDVEVETRLVELCEEVLQLYISISTSTDDSIQKPKWVIPLGSARRRELVSRAPLVVATLQAVSGLKDASFEQYLVRFFPLLAGLISCEHGSGEVQLALSDMFSNWIGPILLQA
uniref:SEC7 domain-containing protein n=1 Tax=Physcomitrium patens TaxID=3218 RepID=A0A7I4A584_PHYPA|nr:brefeldin A-inhibited guanine nucleotide-exchange protein 2-like isoform X2 [Physcomitrium patens]|eukprot:XP_024388580.1 brefeldin A-inhibited guanine nucleotide-exchange protein 2-like isoform X2 [Physcomitrella patens]